jgi:hypothetical protein
MFWNRTKIKKDMIPMIRPTSKVALKQQCLLAANGDIEKAEKIYNFMIKDLEELPMFDAPQLTTMQQAKDMISQGWGWLNENQDNIANWVGIIKSVLNKGGNTGGAPTSPIPPING